jgi:hypothetical protein
MIKKVEMKFLSIYKVIIRLKIFLFQDKRHL